MRHCTAIVAPMLTGKSSIFGLMKLKDVVDSDALVDHASLVAKYGTPNATWPGDYWHRWETERAARLRAAVAGLSLIKRRLCVFTHTAQAAGSAGLIPEAFVMIDDATFAARCAAHPDREELARLNRQAVQEERERLVLPTFPNIESAIRTLGLR